MRRKTPWTRCSERHKCWLAGVRPDPHDDGAVGYAFTGSVRERLGLGMLLLGTIVTLFGFSVTRGATGTWCFVACGLAMAASGWLYFKGMKLAVPVYALTCAWAVYESPTWLEAAENGTRFADCGLRVHRLGARAPEPSEPRGVISNNRRKAASRQGVARPPQKPYQPSMCQYSMGCPESPSITTIQSCTPACTNGKYPNFRPSGSIEV